MEPRQQQAVKKRRRGIYLLPNLITTAALFAGFYGIVAATQGKFEQASVAIFIAMILDALDGRVARMTNTQSEFGAEYDSLADMGSFGLAPALVMYEWSLSSLVNVSYPLGKLGWLAAFLFVASAALRLARFNTKASNTDKRYFQGLPSPAAAGVVVGFVWACFDNGIEGESVALIALPVIVFAGLMMVSNVSYYSFKDIDFHNKVPFVAMLVVVMVFVFSAIDPPISLFGCFMAYALSGPVISILRRFKKRNISQ
ncbi:MAG: CDP-diacylglycerol--serine O-phosphatidyltransferase [Gammaproteobacteria bacterium]|nr:CDP-diacylglycerol--serine O-phosphatidyltransferase [Gammaproteobacteria bacterium]MBT8134895.1 CDP-diacylglycerol--serine O-phosphatidyltransferase [Gammaproteobacteria bacterium]NNJ48742.1 CDP-diacylglycerol--serine O-phosphatidyltransferase [Gammaproteobacteria bacterium]